MTSCGGESVYSNLPPPYLWFHGHNVGELKAALHILCLLKSKQPQSLISTPTILFTTSTPHALIHLSKKLIPQLQCSLPHHSFLAHLLPSEYDANLKDLLALPISSAVFVEPPLHEYLLNSISCPSALLDARFSSIPHDDDESCEGSSRCLSIFSTISSPTSKDAMDISTLCQRPVLKRTSLKFLCNGNSSKQNDLTIKKLSTIVGSRLVWLAASTHQGDESVVLHAHQIITEHPDFKDALLVVVPRDPERGVPLTKSGRNAGFVTVRRAAKDSEELTTDTAVYVADTLGELEMFYQICNVGLIGNSFSKGGKGHNFLEAGREGKCIIHGEYFGAFQALVANVLEICNSNEWRGMWKHPVMEAQDATQIAAFVLEAFSNPDRMNDLGKSFHSAVCRLGKKSEQEVLDLMGDFLYNAATAWDEKSNE